MQSDLGKLFIGGISWDTNEERLKEYFSSFGEVLEAIIMKDRTTGRARGFGFIVFADPSVAERVIKEKHNIDGRMVEAKKAVPRDDQSTMSRNSSSIQGSPGPGRTRKIFVGGLASTVTENDFKRYFEQFGTITDVVVMYDHNTQRPRGFGFITYDSEDAVDKVLFKTFHELNGKMVEVKRAVPKELSPGPTRSPLGGYNYGLSSINSFLNGYSPSSVGGYGRFSPISGGRSGGFAPFGSGYGMSVNFEPGLGPNYGGNASFNNTVSYGRGPNPYFMGNTNNRFPSAIGFDGGNGGSSSFFSSATRNLWGNGGLSYGSNSASSSGYVGSGNMNISGGSGGGGGGFGSSIVNWDASPMSPPQAGGSVSGQGRNFSYGVGGDSNYGGGYGRSGGVGGAPTSSYGGASDGGGYDGPFADFYGGGGGGGGGSVYGGGDATWRSGNSEREGSGSFGFGIDNVAAADLPPKTSPGYVGGGYSVTNRQTNRGMVG